MANEKRAAKKKGVKKKNTGGRPQKICRALIDRVAKGVRKGHYWDTSCLCNDIPKSTMNAWIQQGSKEPNSIYGEFLAKLESADAFFERKCLDDLSKHQGKDPKIIQWKLEHKNARRYGKKQIMRIEDENTKDSSFVDTEKFQRQLIDFIKDVEKDDD